MPRLHDRIVLKGGLAAGLACIHLDGEIPDRQQGALHMLLTRAASATMISGQCRRWAGHYPECSVASSLVGAA